ncbi:carbohydrate porin [Methyloceanibacter sp. wino2]|uniref:carbohydrate porin n=1 Tax=Methyloceanibacter sp. wino2 TaxID=2170729 RepID=UPI000D3E68F5|nr:carbohydrate porin [Methyloceanibacter sp. wino2]
MVRLKPKGKIALAVLCSLLGCVCTALPAQAEDQHVAASSQVDEIGISANPAATNAVTGTGWLGEQLGIDKHGIRLGGVWVGGVNDLVTGGVDPGFTGNSSLVVDLFVDLERFAGLKGSSIGVDFLQLNSQATNTDAGSVLGYIGIVNDEPFNRSELLEAWWRQELFDEHLIVRIGKSNPSIDFQDVVRPAPSTHQGRNISAVSSLLYAPIFVLPTLYQSLGSFYDTVYGVTTTWVPSEAFYVSYGAYDGNKARGVSTGLTGPEFNGYYFHIAEAGTNWALGPEQKPGFLSVGGWRQTGKLSTDDGLITEDGAEGAYFIASQLLWYRDPKPTNDAGVSGYVQFGWNDSETQLFNYYFGAGLTGRALVPSRPKDSFGIGMALGWLNPNNFQQDTELALQAYYQAHVAGSIYTETALSYIPDPAAEPGLDAALAVTQQLIVPF